MKTFAIFGAGRIGQIHAKNVAEHPDATLKYVVDLFPEAAKSLAEATGAVVASEEQVFNDPEIDAVIIASATNTHADLMEKTALAGKDIFCEKPIDLDIERVQQCIKVVDESGVKCSLGFNRRFDPSFNQLKKHVDAGDVGALEMVAITSRDPSPPPAQYVAVSGGLFRDMMIHDLDMARFLLGEDPVSVFATGSCLVDPAIGEAGDIDTAAVTLKTATGKICQISNSRRACYGYDQRIEVFGSKGAAQAENLTSTSVVLTNEQGVTGEKPLHFFLERYEKAYKLELENFIDVLNDKAEPVTNQNDGMQALVLADAALRSYKEGIVVQL